MNFSFVRIAAGVLVAASLTAPLAFGAPLQVAARAQMVSMGFEIYDADLSDGLAPSVSFINQSKHWRTYTFADLDIVGSSKAGALLNTFTYMNAFDSSDQNDALYGRDGSQGKAFGTQLIAGGRVYDKPGYYFEGYAGVSSSATEGPAAGFHNMVLGVGTGVRLFARAEVETWVRDECMETCGNASASAGLLARFGPEDPNNLGTPYQLKTKADYLDLGADASNFSGSGALIYQHDVRELYVTFENLTGGDLLGRVRWDVHAYGEAAAVPEPTVMAFMATGFILLAMQRRRSERAKSTNVFQ